MVVGNWANVPIGKNIILIPPDWIKLRNRRVRDKVGEREEEEEVEVEH